MKETRSLLARPDETRDFALAFSRSREHNVPRSRYVIGTAVRAPETLTTLALIKTEIAVLRGEVGGKDERVTRGL